MELLSGESTVYKHQRCSTLYICIPAAMAEDSQFSIKRGDRVHLTYLPKGGSRNVPVIVVHKIRDAEEENRESERQISKGQETKEFEDWLKREEQSE